MFINHSAVSMLRKPDISRVNRLLFFSVLTGAVLYFGREFFILITFSGFLAMLMTPLANRLERGNVPRVLSSIISILIIAAVLIGVAMLLKGQVTSVSEDFQQIKSKLQEAASAAETWISETLGMSSDQIKEKASESISGAGTAISSVLMGTLSFLGGLLLVLVFTFLFLLHREKYENFAVMLHKEDKRNDARKMIAEISKVAQQYLTGRLISILLLGILYLIGFTILGLENALLLSLIAAIMTFIPYVGPLIGGFIPFFMALVSGTFNQAIWVVVILAAAQLFDNYFIEPYVVGGSVSVSPFFTIFILILGGVLWGIAGVILFLPLLGMLKIVFDNVEGLQPYAYLIGDQKKEGPGENILAKVKELFGSSKGKKSNR